MRETMFDLTVCSPFWPRGLFLSKKLSEQGKKICYIDLKQEALAPLGVFIQENDHEERGFLESLGFLLKQEGGFCLLSLEGFWSFQELDWQNMSTPIFQKAKEKAFGDFKSHWLASLSRNLMSRVFEGNHYLLSRESLDFFSDYFLFEFTAKQKNEFKIANPEINYLETSLEEVKVTLEKNLASISVKNKEIKSRKFLWLADDRSLLNLCSSHKTVSPEWKWKSYSFEGNLGDYEDIIPSHFVSLKDLSLPWTHDNLLSVFYRNSIWDVWVKQVYAREDEDLSDLILIHLNTIFQKALSFKVIPKKKLASFCIYGENKLQQKPLALTNITLPNIANSIQGDLLHQLKYEKQLLETGDFL